MRWPDTHAARFHFNTPGVETGNDGKRNWKPNRFHPSEWPNCWQTTRPKETGWKSPLEMKAHFNGGCFVCARFQKRPCLPAIRASIKSGAGVHHGLRMICTSASRIRLNAITTTPRQASMVVEIWRMAPASGCPSEFAAVQPSKIIPQPTRNKTTAQIVKVAVANSTFGFSFFGGTGGFGANVGTGLNTVVSLPQCGQNSVRFVPSVSNSFPQC